MQFRDVFKNKRILVTGHTGFKGGWLSLWLADLGAEVYGYALNPDTNPNLFSLAQVEKTLHHEEGDLRHFEHVFSVVKKFKPEIVFHLAAQSLVRRSYREPKETVDINVGGTVNLLEAIRRTDSVRAAVIITSDKCYENKEWVWGYRENDPMGGHDLYSASKGAAELIITAYRKSFFPSAGTSPALGVASARAGNVIGGGDFAEDRILPDAVRAAQSGKTLDVRSPTSVRPWQYVLDPLAGYLSLAARLFESPDRFLGGWNFGPSHSELMNVSRLATTFYEALGRGSWHAASQAYKNDLHEAGLLWLSCDKANVELDWHPVLTIKEAVTMTADWYRQVLFEGLDARIACQRDFKLFLEKAASMSAWWAR